MLEGDGRIIILMKDAYIHQLCMPIIPQGTLFLCIIQATLNPLCCHPLQWYRYIYIYTSPSLFSIYTLLLVFIIVVVDGDALFECKQQRSMLNYACPDDNLRGPAREAKQKLDEKFRAHWKLENPKRKGFFRGLSWRLQFRWG